jgi:hypothetical protein
MNNGTLLFQRYSAKVESKLQNRRKRGFKQRNQWLCRQHTILVDFELNLWRKYPTYTGNLELLPQPPDPCQQPTHITASSAYDFDFLQQQIQCVGNVWFRLAITEIIYSTIALCTTNTIYLGQHLGRPIAPEYML